MIDLSFFKNSLLFFLLGVASLLGFPGPAGAVVLPGFDLIVTQDGTEFDPDGPGVAPPIPMVGVPIGLFDFGGSTGIVDVGDVDTIVERKPPPATDGNPMIDTEIIALQLVTAAPVDLGAGLDLYYVTLQSARGLNVGDPAPGPASAGKLTFTPPVDDGGLVAGFFDLFVDLRVGDLTGDIVASIADQVQLSTEKDEIASPVPWSSEPWGTPMDPLPPVDWETSLLIKHGIITIPHPDVPNGGFYLAHEPMPEPSSLVLMGFGLAGPLVMRRRHARKNAQTGS